MDDYSSGGRQPSKRNYTIWKHGEGVPVYEGSYLSDLYTAEVRPWARVGQAGAIVNLAEQEEDDGHLVEIAPGGQTEVLHHMYEASVFILNGRGATSFWLKDKPKQTVEWQRGSIFAPPLNCYYQHFNLDGREPARMFTVTNMPMVLNMFRSPEFIFKDEFVFADRYGSEENYFSDPGQHVGIRQWKTNFVPDLRSFKLDDYSERGAGGVNMRFALSNNQMVAHVSTFPAGTYKMGHKHGAGAHVIILSGVGYSLLWMEGEEPKKVDWHDGSVLSPKEFEFHQHFNTGPTPASYLAV